MNSGPRLLATLARDQQYAASTFGCQGVNVNIEHLADAQPVHPEQQDQGMRTRSVDLGGADQRVISSASRPVLTVLVPTLGRRTWVTGLRVTAS
jgi:hypothetical protein